MRNLHMNNRQPPIPILIRSVIIMVLALSGRLLVSNSVRADDPVVRTVLFWSEGCAHCHEVLEEHLPPLEEEYGERLLIRAIEITAPENYELWLAVLNAYQVPSERQGVPMLIIGDTVLVGSREIPEQLPGLIEQHLAAGGVGFRTSPAWGTSWR